MWRALMSSRFASWVVGRVSMPKARQQQQELDLQRLYILTRMHRAATQGKSPSMQKLLLESQSLEPSTIHREVQAALQLQVAGVAQALHDILQQAGDPAPAAACLTAAHQRLLRRRERNASGLSKLLKGLGLTGRGSGSGAATPQPSPPTAHRVPGHTSGPASYSEAATAAAASSVSSVSAATSAPGSPSGRADGGGAGGGSGGMGVTLSQSQLAAALQERIGFRLELRPSSVPHPEAGTGLFIQGEARPGTVVAIFPGVLYGRTQLVHMPNFPKVDTDNPFLSCRYDQSIVDSKPWGRGDAGVGVHAGADADASSSSSSSDTASRSASAGSGNNSSSSSSGSGSSSGSSSGHWWTWAGPLSSALAYLEGRHPLALGHFVNHPGAGQSPNVIEASLDLPLDHPALDAAAARPWLRAYLPAVQPPLHYNPYDKDAADDEADDDEDDEDDEDDAGKADGHRKPTAGANASASAGGAPPAAAAAVTHGSAAARLPGELRSTELLSPPGDVVRLLVLVSTRGLRDGEELLQNYRMNPHVARPDWYVVHDAEAEQRRWAKVRALDLGFKAKAGGAAGAGTGGGDGGGGGGGRAAGG